MGENEQSGMLRSVVVLGLIAIISFVIIAGVVALKVMTNDTSHDTVNNMAKVAVPYTPGHNGDATFQEYNIVENHWNGNWYRMPSIGPIPSNHWRESHANVTANTDLNLAVDYNDYDYDLPGYTLSNGNDNDEISKRSSVVYEDGKVVSSSLKKGHTYEFVMKYYNNKPRTLYEGKTENLLSALVLSSPDGSPVSLTVNNFEAATYE